MAGIDFFQDTMLPVGSALLFSSTASLWPQTGSSHYAASNAYLDAVAAFRMHCGLQSSSVQYGPFADAGMAAGLASALASFGMESLSPREVILAACLGLFHHKVAPDTD